MTNFLKDLQNPLFWGPFGPNTSKSEFLQKLSCYFLDIKKCNFIEKNKAVKDERQTSRQ